MATDDTATEHMQDIGMVLRALTNLGASFHGDVQRVLDRLDRMERNIVQMVSRVSDLETVNIQLSARVAKCESRLQDLEHEVSGPVRVSKPALKK